MKPQPIPYQIRLARWTDLDSVLALLQKFGYNNDYESSVNRLKMIFYNPHYVNKIVEIDNQIVGMVSMEKSISIDLIHTYTRIILMIVDNDFQNRGIGEALIRETNNYAIEQQTDGIIVFLNPEHIVNFDFLEKNGFSEISKGFAKIF